MILALVAVVKNLKSAAENEGNAAKEPLGLHDIFFVSSRHVECVVKENTIKRLMNKGF